MAVLPRAGAQAAAQQTFVCRCAAGWRGRTCARRSVATGPTCAVVDVSRGSQSLWEARRRARLAVRRAPCVEVRLGHRAFRLRKPLTLNKLDSTDRPFREKMEVFLI